MFHSTGSVKLVCCPAPCSACVLPGSVDWPLPSGPLQRPRREVALRQQRGILEDELRPQARTGKGRRVLGGTRLEAGAHRGQGRVVADSTRLLAI